MPPGANFTIHAGSSSRPRRQRHDLEATPAADRRPAGRGHADAGSADWSRPPRRQRAPIDAGSADAQHAGRRSERRRRRTNARRRRVFLHCPQQRPQCKAMQGAMQGGNARHSDQCKTNARQCKGNARQCKETHQTNARGTACPVGAALRRPFPLHRLASTEGTRVAATSAPATPDRAGRDHRRRRPPRRH